jgi:hypothetical protein
MNAPAFKEWLAGLGAEVLCPTNAYEVVRFKAKGGTHIIYQNGKGKITANGFAGEALKAFKTGKSIDMGLVKTKGMGNFKHKAALVERDGRDCFFCGLPMPEDDMTIEHLIARNKGGLNAMENMALAHKLCNLKAGHMPLMAKIKMRDKLRKEVTNV